MIEPARHVSLRPIRWNESEEKRATLQQLNEHFDAERFWPAHPQDDGVRDGHSSFYFGATGMIWAIDYLGRVGATKARFDFRPVLARLMDANRAELPNYGKYAEHGSLLFGDLGTALLVMRLDPSPATADLIHARADANTTLPVRELMWGTPGSMITCVHMAAMTAEPRWRALFAIQAARLLEELEETDHGPLWTQDLYGNHRRYLGPVHGYAGNMIALMRGWEWLTDAQHRRNCSTDLDRERLAFRAWRLMARGRGRPRGNPAALPALSRRSRHGHGVRGCAVHVA